MNINMLSNAELNVKMKEMEHEYEALKSKINECIEKMEYLDNKYIQFKEVYNNRTKGKI